MIRATQIQPDAASRQRSKCAAARVEHCLEHAPYDELHAITCRFDDGVATLRGRVPSYFLKQIAQSIVTRQPGVERVVNRIEVTSAPAATSVVGDHSDAESVPST
jgi:osmotically-inducible protein OsmY